MGELLSVVVQIDLHGADVRLVVTGTVTDATQRVLHPLMDRARSILPGAMVWVDLTGADRVETTAVELLQSALQHDHPDSGAGSVKILTPADCLGAPPVPGPGPSRALLGGESRYDRFHHPRRPPVAPQAVSRTPRDRSLR